MQSVMLDAPRVNGIRMYLW